MVGVAIVALIVLVPLVVLPWFNVQIIKGAVPSPTRSPSPVAGLPQATPYAPVAVSSTPTVSGQGTTFYVSRTGSNADGKSWASAWNELDQINWAAIQPGDTITLDGGAQGSHIIYNTPLVIGKSGNASAPITIRLSQEAGRDGAAFIFGGRSTPLPYCDQPQYTYQTQGVYARGIEVGDNSWIVVDGTRWSGITIYGHNESGIHLTSAASNNTFRNLEIYDNGQANLNQTTGAWRSDLPGVYLSGSDNLFERDLIHDNGQDAFQSNGGLHNVTVRQSWLYNLRPHPSNPSLAFNYCMHSDGMQVYNGGVQTGVNFDSDILGPGLMQGAILGQAPSNGNWAEVDDVTFQNVLILDTTNANIMGYPTVQSRNWTIRNVTSFHVAYDPDQPPHNAIFLEGSNLNIEDSIIYGGNNYLPNGAQTSGNFQFDLTGFSVGTRADPLFVNAPSYDSQPDLQTVSKGDYALQPGSPAAGKGSALTSVAQLMALPASAEGSPSPTPTIAGVPDPSGEPQPILVEAESGDITAPFAIKGDFIVQTTSTLDVSEGGRVSYPFNIEQSGDYLVSALVLPPDVNSNSLFLNIDRDPVSPDMTWDINYARSFVWQTASWRGAGTPKAPQYSPKVFHMEAGPHTLIVVGRESNLEIDKFRLDFYK